ncbi:nucleoside triphosphate pyrophosphatase [Alteromonas sp. KUL49]|uniref:Maf family protein n=1 Tax=Alteromonas sp. KUL49 TaxID=2480798 RepID=UPI00102EE0C5|nr:nucleoside triphosphate pyrophosphatase [Alteromonas sp. KUL49]TAP35845.1 septum formation protein Maf [Alteromonas sp. KUL49]GEA13224.1 Maf-like protein [Alteromonas sp. KUL49]
MTQLILASSSPYRQQLLAQIGVHVRSHAPDIDETPRPGESPISLSKRLAVEKAEVVAKKFPNDIVIGCDQVALVETDDGRELLGKPGNVENAVNQLLLCQGRIVHFFTALSLSQHSTKIAVTHVEETKVHFRTLTEDLIRAYIAAERPLDCAGSFKSEGMGVLLFERITSRDPNSLIGLPIMLLHNLLERHFEIDLLEIATQPLPASKCAS